eukprot:4346702-Pyramimonas_sp.AAC.1
MFNGWSDGRHESDVTMQDQASRSSGEVFIHTDWPSPDSRSAWLSSDCRIASSNGNIHLYPQTYKQNESVDDPILILHSIKGRPQHGLIIDPGAAEGLLGTETLLEWKRDIYDKRGLSYQLEPSNATFT